MEIFLKDETIWLTQDRIAELFGVQRPAVTKHLKNVFESGELQEDVVSSYLELTTPHGAIDGKTQTRSVKFYNLDAIISVGYRVNSRQATLFRMYLDFEKQKLPTSLANRLIRPPTFMSVPRWKLGCSRRPPSGWQQRLQESV